jgi:hypothetical protein
MVVDRRVGWVLALALTGCGDAGSGTGGAGSETGATGSVTTSGGSTPTGSGSTGGASMTGSASATDSVTGSASATDSVTGSASATIGDSETASATIGDSETSATIGDSETASSGAVMTGSSSGGASSDSSSSGGEASTGMLSASSGEGSSSGAAPECLLPADCPPPPGECVQATCVAEMCGQGPEDVGVVCSQGECDGQGNCVECLSDADCASKVCEAGVCADASCGDGVKNGSESDVDCGGSCGGCALGESCGVAADCASKVCTGGTCVAAGPACAMAAADPVTGQRCPLFMPCTASAECGDFVGCQQWFCNNAKTCELNAKVDCWTNKGGGCNADVVFTQHTLPPVDKRFMPPDNVSFREVASLAFTVKNNTANDLYLDKLPLQLELMGGGSKFDVSSVKIFDNSGGTEHGLGDILVCLTADPFSFPANGVMGPCGGSAFSKVLKGQSNQFVVNVAFAKEKTFIDGRSYRLVMGSTAGIEFKVGFNGPLFAGSMCGVQNGGFVGAWVKAQKP